MIPSSERDLKDQIKAAEHKATENYHIAIRKAVEVINRAKFLTIEEKEELIEGLYK